MLHRDSYFCIDCEEEKPAKEFPVHKRRTPQHCKACITDKKVFWASMRREFKAVVRFNEFNRAPIIAPVFTARE